MKSGFATLHYNIPISLESSNVYHMSMEGDTKFPISIIRTPSEAKLVFEGKDYGTSNVIPDVTPGRYPIRLYLQGYGTITDTLEVDKNNLNFKYELEEAEPQMVRIYSNPEDATILLND